MSRKPFDVGARVRRQVDVFDHDSPYRHGTVIERYGRRSMFGWYDHELYAVKWDDGIEQRGFFRHGLTPEEP